ncbi:MAG: septum site-determining protein MinD [Clostridiales bacterium]|jgi:septum site-determining protein MinD|nr:septum site-determining protein MinD [Clostridiales bacterium]
MGRKLVFTSGKGGVGKTTMCANIGIALSMLGQKVVMVDADIGLNNLDVVMCVENKVAYDVADVVEGKCRLKQALIQDADFPSLYILPSFHNYDTANITAPNFKSIIDTLSVGFDFVIIDCPAGIDSGFHRAVAAASEAYVVTTPHISAVRDADKVMALLNGYPLLNIGLVVNRVRGDMVISGEMMTAGDISRLLRCTPTGIIPDDDTVTVNSDIMRHNTECEVKQAIMILAENILSGKRRIYDCTDDYRGIFGKLKARLKKMF